MGNFNSTVAQPEGSEQTFILPIPGCAAQCKARLYNNTGCQELDLQCLCENHTFLEDRVCCELESCGIYDLQDAYYLHHAVCRHFRIGALPRCPRRISRPSAESLSSSATQKHFLELRQVLTTLGTLGATTSSTSTTLTTSSSSAAETTTTAVITLGTIIPPATTSSSSTSATVVLATSTQTLDLATSLLATTTSNLLLPTSISPTPLTLTSSTSASSPSSASSSSKVASSTTPMVGSTLVVATPANTDPMAAGSSSTNVGAIAGGVVGGVLGLALIVVLVFWLVRRKQKQMNTALAEVQRYPVEVKGTDT